MADKMIAVSERDAEKIAEIQASLDFPVTIKSVVSTAISKLHFQLIERVKDEQ